MSVQPSAADPVVTPDRLARPTPPASATNDLVIPARWDPLRRYTDARIALGRAGHSQPTAAHLAFQLAHAQARDAVHLPFDAQGVAQSVEALGLQTLQLHSAAADRATYLQRPDLGRRLDQASRTTLVNWQYARQAAGDGGRFDLAFVIADGLSALAVHQNAAALVEACLSRFSRISRLATNSASASPNWRIAPVAVVEQARVAIGDETGAGLQADLVVVLIGERPGLSSPDSLGVYLTWAPQVGLTDAGRNCISNVRPAGLPIDAAADKLVQLLTQSRLRQLSGVDLKDDRDDQAPRIGHTDADAGNFLLPAARSN
ncbi:MAG: ethanolamine ammonia-lyase subunit EutC [Leptothrix sp. (in: b-proteobacteria)]